jgi:malonyl-CoA/methylmalonyl-CoA synthetase
MIKLIENAKRHKERTAIKCGDERYSYQYLLNESEKIALNLLNGKKDLKEARIAFLVQPGIDYVCLQWGIWRAGGIAIPLCVKHPYPSIKYVIDDTAAAIVILEEEFDDLLAPLKIDSRISLLRKDNFLKKEGQLPKIELARRAMILYTSGTTGLPKGVVTTHQNIEAQITALTTSWEWNKEDHILNVLPLHHVHGIINVLSCALWSGGCCEFLPKFSPKAIFEIFSRKEVNLFMAVPTIYFKLIAYWDELPDAEKDDLSNTLKDFRLMVSGSAALPISVMEKWHKISQHYLLERYGMTEMGMAISNPYNGERKPGHIGQALNKVTIRIVDIDNQLVDPGEAGEIQVKGPNVFHEYWNKPEETKKTFTADGWFKTGDIALDDKGSYKILGRNSVDIIKSGGYKISALEIEDVLRAHPMIKDCGVVGLPDEEWGEIVAASLLLNDGPLDMDALKNWLKEKLPGYKIPRKFMVQEYLPRNVMGKVTKKELKKMFG